MTLREEEGEMVSPMVTITATALSNCIKQTLLHVRCCMIWRRLSPVGGGNNNKFCLQ